MRRKIVTLNADFDVDFSYAITHVSCTQYNFFISRQHAMHAERDIVLPILSVCLSNANVQYVERFIHSGMCVQKSVDGRGFCSLLDVLDHRNQFSQQNSQAL